MAGDIVKALITVGAICLFLLGFFSLSLAADYYKATTYLNVRSGPGTEYPVLFVLDPYEEVELVAKVNNWYKIRCRGRTGYAYSTYLIFSRSISEPSPEVASDASWLSLLVFLF